MYCRNSRFENLAGRGFTATMVSALSLLLVSGIAPACLAQQPGQRTFSSAQEATHALFLAIQKDNDPALMGILGGGKELICSDDTRQDKHDRAQFLQKYREMHRLVREPDGTTVLYIGAENWPFPIPLLSKKHTWYFDADSGRQEVLFRRIGENEMAAIQTCKRLVRDEKEHATNAGNGPLLLHGYYFRSLAQNGAGTSVSNSKRADEPTLIAYPADYRVTGVMTFIVKRNGMVYEKDLGKNTAKYAKQTTGYVPVSTWVVAKEESMGGS
jgi:hypothetical protein